MSDYLQINFKPKELIYLSALGLKLKLRGRK